MHSGTEPRVKVSIFLSYFRNLRQVQYIGTELLQNKNKSLTNAIRHNPGRWCLEIQHIPYDCKAVQVGRDLTRWVIQPPGQRWVSWWGQA